MTNTEIAMLLGFILLLIIGCVVLPTCLIFMASFLATTKTLGYVFAILAIVGGYLLTFSNYVCYCTGFITDIKYCLLPLPASGLLFILIFTLSMIYEKVKYHEIFYPYKGD